MQASVSSQLIIMCTTSVKNEHEIMLTRQRARQIARIVGFDSQNQTRISAGVSEIARNAVLHGGGGKAEFGLTTGPVQSLEVVISDNGPGIKDVATLLKAGRVQSCSRGQTLRGVSRLLDTFRIDSSTTKGTVITLGKVRPRHLPDIQHADISAITNELVLLASQDPLAEMQLQNQELLRALEQIQLEQESSAKHLLEIEKLNARLKRTIQSTHHRVKNNLQIISAMVDVQTDPDDKFVPVTALTRIGQHARGIAAVHDLLTEESKGDAEVETVRTRNLMDRLIPLLQSTNFDRVITYDVDDLSLPICDGVSLTLLVSELISNSVKHGQNEIAVTFRVIEGHAVLEVCDDGPGFPRDFDWTKAANTGLALIDSTGRYDLHGTISYQNRVEGGAQVLVSFPIKSHD